MSDPNDRERARETGVSDPARPSRKARRIRRAERVPAARPDPVERAFAAALERLELEQTKVVVAVSGGRDSATLLELFRRIGPARGLELEVAHIHHGLRGAEADLDAAHVEALAKAAGRPFHLRRVDPKALRAAGPSRSRPSPEEAARALRRAALAEVATERGASVIALAHHAGDQAETILLRLLRGTGPDGLAGMSERSDDGRLVRPLLTLFPDALDAYARRQRLVWREDASNRDLRFTRNRIRHALIPTLEREFNPGLLRALVDLAEAAGEDRVFMEAAVEEAAAARLAWREPVLQLSLEGWRVLPESLARRVVRRGLGEAGLAREVSRRTIERVLEFVRRERSVGRDKTLELPGGFSLRRVDDHFELAPDGAQSVAAPRSHSPRSVAKKVGEGAEC